MWAQTAVEIGKIIVAARRHQGLTQAALAKAVGSSQAWVSEIEQGKDTAQIGKVLHVLSYLGVRLQTGVTPWQKSTTISPSTGKISLTGILAAHSTARPKRKPR